MNKVDSQSPLPPDDAAATDRPGITRSPIPQYLMLTAGSTQAERLYATSDEDAQAQVRRRVRQGQVNSICLYRLMSAEVYEASSSTLTPEQALAAGGLFTTNHRVKD